MDTCVAVEKELEKVLGRFRDIDQHTSVLLKRIIEDVERVTYFLPEGSQEDLNSSSSSQCMEILKKLLERLSNVSSEHRDLHASVSKVGKAIDKNFISDYSPIVAYGILESEGSIRGINHVICEHFLRQGMLDIAQNLIDDSHLDVEETYKDPFIELHCILEALSTKEIEPALKWAEDNRETLQAQGSSLEFKLHRLKFINLLKCGPDAQNEIMWYGRKFSAFAYSHAKEIQVLMGSLLYLKQGIENSPYSHLFDPISWAEICDVFTRDACSLLGLSVESPLSVVIRAGCLALPPLLNIKQVMQQRACTGVWSAKDELPIEIDVGNESQYHSIFACPILRQQSTDNNPPMRLICGHVISRDALNKLANGTKLRGYMATVMGISRIATNQIPLVKCPYCPVEQSPNDARQIYF